ncbi:MAG: methyltransferase domain-containing protein [Geobacteraceae bacterium]|nr:methyltransferase domain-containing protein [Geobacteraceae bacterium]
MLKHYLNSLVRSRTTVSFGDIERLDPVSRVFGLERGTPVDRFYIERFLMERSDLIRGEVLEIGSDLYTRRFGGNAVSHGHVLAAKGTHEHERMIIGDLSDSTSLPAEQMDCFICTQTLNFIYDVPKAVEGALHLLKPGGTLLATVAGISQVSRYDMDRWGDYWRFTTASLERLFTPVFGDGVVITSHGNLPVTLAFLQGLSVEDLPDPTLLDVVDPDYQLLLTIIARKGRK